MTQLARTTTLTAASPNRPAWRPPPLTPVAWRTTHEPNLAHPVAARRPGVRLLQAGSASRVADQPRPGNQGRPRPAPDREAHRRAAGRDWRLRAHRALREGFRLRPEVERGHR